MSVFTVAASVVKRDQSPFTMDHQLATAWAVGVDAVVPDGDVEPPEAGAALVGAVLGGDVVGDDRWRVAVELEPAAPFAEAVEPPPLDPDAFEPRSVSEPLFWPAVPVASRPLEPFRCLPEEAEWVAPEWVVGGLAEGEPPHAARPKTTRTVTPAPQTRLTDTVSLARAAI
ncbi:MAG TPA: hypothetical protein VMB82_11355 [Acidimicrobiales bacterium]|nr:hypothetical protein [Acidimicrobiales bacterium]